MQELIITDQIIINIGQSFVVRFVDSLRDYERSELMLRRLNFKYRMEDVTKENSLSFREGVKEVLFLVEVKNVEEAALLRNVANRIL